MGFHGLLPSDSLAFRYSVLIKRILTMDTMFQHSITQHNVLSHKEDLIATYDKHILYVVKCCFRGLPMLLKTEDVAQQLYMTAYTIRKYIRLGKLKARKVGKQYLVPQTEVDRILAEYQSTDTANKGDAL
jgi:excisionase family DNA binding protein